MIRFFLETVRAVFSGARGVKEIRRGADTLYARPGGFFYLTLKDDE